MKGAFADRLVVLTAFVVVLLAAKRARLIKAVQPLVTRLAGRGFTLPGDVRRALLRDAGE